MPRTAPVRVFPPGPEDGSGRGLQRCVQVSHVATAQRSSATSPAPLCGASTRGNARALAAAGLAPFATESGCIVKGLLSFLASGSLLPEGGSWGELLQATGGTWHLVAKLTSPRLGKKQPAKGQEQQSLHLIRMLHLELCD